MGDPAMKTRLNPLVVAGVIYLMVFAQAHWSGMFFWAGTRLDLIPCFIVYAASKWSIPSVTALSIWAGICFDSLSSNPLGTTIVPLFLIGFVLCRNQENLLYSSWPAQAVLGVIACGAVPLLSLVELEILGAHPLTGWMTVWQIIFMAIAGGLLTPLIFGGLEYLQRALSYESSGETPFRSDREIKRGKF